MGYRESWRLKYVTCEEIMKKLGFQPEKKKLWRKNPIGFYVCLVVEKMDPVHLSETKKEWQEVTGTWDFLTCGRRVLLLSRAVNTKTRTLKDGGISHLWRWYEFNGTSLWAICSTCPTLHGMEASFGLHDSVILFYFWCFSDSCICELISNSKTWKSSDMETLTFLLTSKKK